VEAWRRVAALDPYSSRIALQLMRALAAAGDRAGALQHARVHELLLREEFGTAPDAEVTALAERLREDPGVVPSPPPSIPPPAAPPAPQPAARETEAEAPATPAASSAPAALAMSPPPAPGTRPRRARRLALAAVVGGPVAAGGLWMAVGRQSETPSIAVLPFSDLSPARDFEYFGEGLAEEILDALSRVEGLEVAARTSSFVLRQRGLDVAEVGERLRVRTVLEGSVRRSGDRLRVRVSLVDVATGDYLWSEEYERRMEDVLRMQDEISLEVVSALKGRLVERDSAQVIHVTTRDPQAYDLYLRGRAYWYQRTAEGFRSALESFQRAVARDPNYAVAHVGLADVYALLASPDYGVLPPKQAFPRARAELTRALELDPESAEAHAALGNVLTFYDHDWAEAEREFRRALELNRGYTPALHWYALHLVATGQPERAIATIRRARELEPLSVLMTTASGRVLYFAHQYEASIREYGRALEMDSGYVAAHLGLGLALVRKGEPGRAIAEYRRALALPGGRQPVVSALLAHAYAVSGRKDEARALLREISSAPKGRYVPAEYAALIHLGLGEHDAAIAELERAYRLGSGYLAYLRVEPLFDPLRSDPRFVALERRVGL
jgi:TolB-like protein/Tfp pilus assembly protein PilF